jgi:hypothetical protein
MQPIEQSLPSRIARRETPARGERAGAASVATHHEEEIQVATQQSPTRPEVSGWAFGGVTFAACVLTLIGGFQIIIGLVAIIDDEFYVVARNYTFELDTSAWGWIHLLLGLLLVATGFGLFAKQTWAAATAIFLALLSALANFFFIPYYPFWAILVIALNVWVIWSLTRPGVVGPDA